MTESSNWQARPLRFGIMCRGASFAAWEADCIEHLIAAGVEPALLIVDDRPPPPRIGLGAKSLQLFNPKTLLWRLYQRAILNRSSRSTAPVDLSSKLRHLPIVRCRPAGKVVQRFSEEETAEIRCYDLDFVMRFAFNILRGEILDSARYGIWSFHHDDPEKYRGAPPGFWEIYNRDPVTGAVLQRLTEKLDAGTILHKGFFRTNPLSYPRSRDDAFLGAADWPSRVCRDIRNGNAAALDAAPLPTSAPIYRAPTSLQMLRFLWITVWALVRHQFDTLFRAQQWSIGIIGAPISTAAGLDRTNNSPGPLPPIAWLPEPRGRFLADCFAVAGVGEQLTILAEDFSWKTGKGHIAIIESRAAGGYSAPVPALKLPCHLSYPYLFEYDGSFFCVPEMHQSGDVALYRLDRSFQEWTKVATLLRGMPIVDPTIFQHGGMWWLFCTREDLGANLKLLGWYSHALEGPWIQHPANPLKTDVRSSRPAGRPFLHSGELIRPAQDCSTGYGAAVVFNRIVRLTPNEFEEVVIGTLAPDPNGPYPSGLHTICGAGDFTVIDGSRAAFIPAVFARAALGKFSRLVGRKTIAAPTSSVLLTKCAGGQSLPGPWTV